MIRKQIRHLVAPFHDTVASAYWRFCKYPSLTIVVDDTEKYWGVLGRTDYDLIGAEEGEKQLLDFANKSATVIVCDSTIDEYAKARNIFAEKTFNFVPVISTEHDVLDIFTRESLLSALLQRRNLGTNELCSMHICCSAGGSQIRDSWNQRV